MYITLTTVSSLSRLSSEQLYNQQQVNQLAPTTTALAPDAIENTQLVPLSGGEKRSCALYHHEAAESSAVQELLQVLRAPIPSHFQTWIPKPLFNSSSLLDFVQHATQCARVWHNGDGQMMLLADEVVEV